MKTLKNPTSREIVKMGQEQMNAHSDKLKKALIKNGVIINGKLSEEQKSLLNLIDEWFDGMPTLKNDFFKECADAGRPKE